MFSSDEQKENLSVLPCRQSIAELEHIVNASTETGSLEASYSPDIERKLMKAVKMNLRPSMHFQMSSLKHVLESVRNIVLQWSLKLEEDGVVGDGMSFTADEVAIARTANYTINYFAGDVSHSQIQQGANASSQSGNKDD